MFHAQLLGCAPTPMGISWAGQSPRALTAPFVCLFLAGSSSPARPGTPLAPCGTPPPPPPRPPSRPKLPPGKPPVSDVVRGQGWGHGRAVPGWRVAFPEWNGAAERGSQRGHRGGLGSSGICESPWEGLCHLCRASLVVPATVLGQGWECAPGRAWGQSRAVPASPGAVPAQGCPVCHPR